MTSPAVGNIAAQKSPFLQCRQCEQKLPLRITGSSDQKAAAWKCAKCNAPVVGICEMALLLRNSRTIMLNEQYFDVSNLPKIDLEQRRRVAEMAQRKPTSRQSTKRRSQRISQSLVAPAICLTPGLMPFESPFQVMVANLSREGVGFVHLGRIKSNYIAMVLTPRPERTIQVIVKIVRHLQLEGPYFEVGGEFHLRLGGKGRA